MNESIETKKPFRWGFLTSPLVILVVIIAAEIVGRRLEQISARAKLAPDGSFFSNLQASDWLLGGFFLSAAVFVFLQRGAIARFFRSMYTGVSLVSMSLLAVGVGVLVPQISSFEDPEERVPVIADIDARVVERYMQGPRDDHSALAALSNDQEKRLLKYREEYQAFRWAEGYFIYHLLHPYGLGMPATELPESARQGLERFGNKYGREEKQNREKQMNAAFSGNLKANEIGELIRANDDKFRAAFDISTALHLNRTYKSHWFAALLSLLFVGVAMNTFKGKLDSWFTARRAGFIVTHFGIMTLLIGGCISKQKTVRGILHLDTRAGPENQFQAFFNPEKPLEMPFWLKAERFARRDWKTLEVGFLDEEFTSNPPPYTLWPGREIELDYQPDEQGVVEPRIKLRVLSIHERARVGPGKFWESEPRNDPNGMGPLFQLGVTSRADTHTIGDGTPPNEQLAFLQPGLRRGTLYDPDWKYRLAVDYSDDDQPAKQMLRSSDEGRLGYLSVRVSAQGDVEPARIPFRLGEVVQAPGGYSIAVREATADFRYDKSSRTPRFDDERPLAEQYPRNPALAVEITPPGGGHVERRLVLEAIDAETHELQKQYDYPDLVLKLEWERWSSQGPPRFVLSFGPTREPVLLSEDGQSKRVGVGDDLPLPGGYRVVPRALLHNARFEKSIEFDPEADHIDGPQFDPNFYALDPTCAEIEVTINPGRADQRIDVVRFASTEASMSDRWLAPDQRFYLRYFHNTAGFPFEWRSVLSVWNKDAAGNFVLTDAGSEAEREIRVNDYFFHRGYRFFQTNAIPEAPTYSGIGVVYDPGIPVVLAGMYIIILGTLLAFIVRPIVDAYGKRHPKTLSAG